MDFSVGQAVVCRTSDGRYFDMTVTAVGEMVEAGGKCFDLDGSEHGNGKTQLLEATEANTALVAVSSDADLARDLIQELAQLEGTDVQFATITRRLQLALAAFEGA